jgi:hypothetical protein
MGWTAAALLVQPALSLAYLLAVRAEQATPAFTPVIAIAVFPVAVAVIALREGAGAARWVVGALALLELMSLVVLAMLVGWAKALQSG